MQLQRGIWWLAGIMSVLAFIVLAFALVLQLGRYEALRIVPEIVGTPYSSHFTADIGIRLPQPNDGVIEDVETRMTFPRDQREIWRHAYGQLDALKEAINAKIVPQEMSD